MPSFPFFPHFQLLDTSGWPESACAECIYILDGMKTLKAAILKSHSVLYEHLRARMGSPLDSDLDEVHVKTEVPDEVEDKKSVIPEEVEDKKDFDLKAHKKEEEKSSDQEMDWALEEGHASSTSSEAESDSADVKKSTKKKKKKEEKGKTKRRKRADENSLEEVMHTMDLLKCHECRRPHDRLKDLFKHLRREHGNSRGYIFCCDRKKIGYDIAFDHIRVHLDQDVFKCRSCGQRLPTKWSLQLHIRQEHTHPQDRSYMCDVCGQVCETRSGFESHVKYHTAPEDRQFRCNICEGGFTSHYQLKRHTLTIHERTFICDQCGRGFTQQSLLSLHKYQKHYDRKMGSMHKDCKRMPCEKCGVIVSERNLQAHLANNCFKGDSPLTCIFCDMKLKTKKSLLAHMRRKHPERTSMSCAHCPFQADSGQNLMLHTRDYHPAEFVKLKYTIKD